MKKQIKKSLSLFLAVLMLLTSWVWVAPEKAEAVDTPTYSVTIVYDVVNTAENGGNTQVWYYPFNSDGSLSSTMTSFDISNTPLNSMFHEGNNSSGCTATAEGIPGWPCKIKTTMNGKLANDANVDLKAVKINNVTVIEGNWNHRRNLVSGSVSKTLAWDKSGGDEGSASLANWTKPSFTTLTKIEATDAGTLGKLPNGSSITTTGKIVGGRDKYGADLPEYYFPTSGVSYSIKDANGNAVSGASVTGTGKTATITLTDDVQKAAPNAASGFLYLYATYNGTTASNGFKYYNPTYTITFDGNDGKIGSTDADAKDKVEMTSGKMYYGSIIGKSPAHRKKDGFVFMGFYSNKNADAPGLTASFTGTKFVDSETTVKDNGDMTYYAAWMAKPITATFMTADNQLIGTVEGRHNNNYTNANMYNGLSGLNAAVKAAYEGSTIQFNSNNEPVYKDGSTTYTFAGWKIIEAYDDTLVDKIITGEKDVTLTGDVTFQAVYTKADAKTYTVSFEDGNGTVISSKNDYKYRDAVTGIPADNELTKETDDKYSYEFIGWANKLSGVNFFAVDANDCDESGAKLVYTSKDAAEFTVRADATYIPVFRMINREYNVKYNYKVDGGATESVTIGGYHWDDNPVMPEIKDNYTEKGFRYHLLYWKDSKGQIKQLNEIYVNGDTEITAVYGNAEAAEYTINFYGKAADGETDVLLNANENLYKHNAVIKVPSVEQYIDTGDALYTFDGWSPSVERLAGGDVDYYATYTKQTYADIHYYNYDGTLIYEVLGSKDNSLFVDETIPAYVGDEPVKPEDPTGTYTFTGWKDGSGKVFVPGESIFEGDTYLYAQFDTKYKEYTVKFENDILDDEGNKVVVSEKKYHYGEEIVIPANPTKPTDVQYEYTFKSWTPDISNICYGNATYVATYRRAPVYYKVTWLNDKKEFISSGNYMYNAKINQGIIEEPAGYPVAPGGSEWALAYWVLCDASGRALDENGVPVAQESAVRFERGMKMPAKDIYFYPVFEAKANVITVSFYDAEGQLLGSEKIDYGKNLSDYADKFAAKAVKTSDADYHYVIENWKNKETNEIVTVVNDDVSVVPEYKGVSHNPELIEIKVEPTANVPGYGYYKCTADECSAEGDIRLIAPVADEGEPTGTIYVGTTKWSYEDKDSINFNDVTYVSPNTQLIVNAKDKGTDDNSPARGVGKIEYSLQKGEKDPTTITKWTEIYDSQALIQDILDAVLAENKITIQEYMGYVHGTNEDKIKKAEIDKAVDLMFANYNANATGVVSNLNLKDGENYVIYIKVSDREGMGEVNSCYFSSGTISGDSKPAEINITGNGFGTKFCAEANIKVVDNNSGFEIYLDDELVKVNTTSSASGIFAESIKCNEKGVHTVKVIDRNGNTTVKIFEIKGSHTFRNYVFAATCEADGLRYELCTICGEKANEKVITKRGHNYINYIDKEPTCVDNGTRTYVCDNNCGTKLVVSFDAENNEWKNLTEAKLEADDVKHLKATGVHTYAKATDENGNETGDAWVIDKAATCEAEGSKHKDCIKCGDTVTETIPRDKENGHKFYREKVTTEPTCTTKGEKTKTCRYCGYVEHVADIDALEHTEGEYRINVEPTCQAAGNKMLTCATCGQDIGKEYVEIPALGCAWKKDGDVQKVEDNVDGEIVTVFVQYYKCTRCGETRKDILEEYVEPKEVTVTFVNGEETVVELKKFVGESITAADVAAPAKAEDDTYIYTFAYWTDAEGKEVKFPIDVKDDATYKAQFTTKYKNYTITYYYEDGRTEYKKTGYLHNGAEVKVASAPTKAATNLVTYKFAGWEVINSDPKVVYTENVTIDGSNIKLKATYTDVKKTYAVTYAYSSGVLIHTYTVEAGTPAPDVTRDFGEIVKDYDTKNHYTFKGWNKAAQLAEVESNIYTTPDFEPANHTYNVTVKTAATCTSDRIDTYTCTVCGYSYNKEAAGTTLSHIWGEPVYNAETGKNVVTCTREGCGATEEDTRSFTVKFFVNADDTTAHKTVSYIKWGTTITANVPAPSKDSDNLNTYTFAGWALKGTTEVVDLTKYEVKADAEFVAVFTATKRLYSVIFAYDAKNVIKTYTDVEAGSDVILSGVETPEKAYDINYHYTFSGWKDYDEGVLEITVENVQKDYYILAEFNSTMHTYEESSLGQATCTNGAGSRYKCTCGYYYDVAGKPEPHDYKEIERVPATEEAAGYVKYKCENCEATKTEELKFEKNTIEIIVDVKTHDGKPVSNAIVELYYADGEQIKAMTTGSAGRVTFEVDKNGKYEYMVAYENAYITDDYITANEGVNTVKLPEVNECSCACHGDGLWASIFRFFHKIIKMIAGEFKCCNDPDPRYN